MNKYRVLKAYPKQITNSGRLLTLKKGQPVYLKTEAQVLRLIALGYIKPMVEMPKKAKKPAPEASKSSPAEIQPSPGDAAKKKSKSEYLSKKNQGESPN